MKYEEWIKLTPEQREYYKLTQEEEGFTLGIDWFIKAWMVLFLGIICTLIMYQYPELKEQGFRLITAFLKMVNVVFTVWVVLAIISIIVSLYRYYLERKWIKECIDKTARK